VEASAGTGKTRELVNQIVKAIVSGVPVDRIVAVTFTHAAAGEMKLRVRQELDRARTNTGDAASRALQELDRAFIGTIHSFCAHLLRQRPVEACVDPSFDELSEGEAFRLFSSVFRIWIQEELAAPSPALRRAIARLSWEDSAADPIDRLRSAAWDLAKWRDHPELWESRPFDREAELTGLIEQARGAAREWRGGKREPLDDFITRVDAATRAQALDFDTVETELLRLPWAMRRANFNRDPEGGPAWTQLVERIEKFRRPTDAELAAGLRNDLWHVVLRYEDAKKRAGQLDFLDLLVYARNLLRHDSARAALQRRYDRIFIDEFQDTDSLQAEILLLLSSSDATNLDWRTAVPGEGKLFVVGDPKQSIYRFRRAHAALYNSIRVNLASVGVGSRKLSISHRSNADIQRFVNTAFARMPDYLPLEGGPPAAAGQPAVVALPMPYPYGSRDLAKTYINSCSPDAVAAFIHWLVNDSGWTVRDPSTKEPVRVCAEHVCVLFRRFTNNGVDLTQEYVRALEARGVEHVLVGSKSFHQREEIGTLRTALRAIEWPEDELSVFAVLRGSLFAISDGTLLKFRAEFKRFSPWLDLPDDLDEEFDAIRDCLTILRELHRDRNRRPIAATVSEMLARTRAHVSFAFRKGGERVLANVSRFLDLARSFEADGATSFRAFIDYLDDESASAGTTEAPVLEQQAGGVKLMTVHKAKGLEFPVVILADLTANLTSRDGGDRYVDPDRRLCAQRLLMCAPWELLDHADKETQADYDEGVRVAYVAATRASDILVVSAIGDGPWKESWLSPLWEALYPHSDRWRTPSPAPGCPPFGMRSVLRRPADIREEISVRPGLHHTAGGGDYGVLWFDPAILDLERANDGGLDRNELLRGSPDQETKGLQNYESWRAGRDRAIGSGSTARWRIERISETTAVSGAGEIPVEIAVIEGAPQRPAGRRFGKLVHAVLQSARTDAPLEPVAATCGRRLGASTDEMSAAAEAARRTLDHPALRELRGWRQHRELPVMLRIDEHTIAEGNVDLACTDGASWVVIDYKTDSAAQGRYRRQLQLYALALRRATNQPVRGLLVEI
jgi:ATP-dependent exoDNAse (exonuclease V) beta subunit